MPLAPLPPCRLPGPQPRPAPYAPPFDSRQYASAFNQPLSFDTSSVTYTGGYTGMVHMFDVRFSPFNAHTPACCVRRGRPPPPSSRPTPRLAPYAFLPTRQDTFSLSDDNKLLIRCAWAGTSAFASADYGSSWGPGSCDHGTPY
eukprot:scaffold106778_cov65-Phaeocystis_antarctica.AAC.2